MKSASMIAALVLASGFASVYGAKLVATGGSPAAAPAAWTPPAETPMARVVTLLQGLQLKIENEGKAEQDSYDKYACWIEETLARKANDISEAKKLLEELEVKINELAAAIASHEAEIEQVKKDIAANLESQREATEVRNKQNEDYSEERTESEQCIGALEAAITVLNGAGAGKTGFLGTLQETKLISVAAGIRSVLAKSALAHFISDKDLQTMRHFMSKPEEFVGGRSGLLSAAQIANNPFGDYAPQSTQIQGIIKGMYDTFSTDLEKANAEESDQQKAHEEFMATKQMELNTLQITLQKHTMDKAQLTKDLAESKQLRDDTKVQLEADERFFAQTKEAGKLKATEWSERVRLRTEELHGIAQAIQILNDDGAQEVFYNATTTFLQVASASGDRTKVFAQLKGLVKKYHSVSLAKVASQVQVGGHFDKVIVAIDKMIETLRKEEAADIEHRDRCQGANNKNGNDIEDLGHAITKTGDTITRLGNEKILVEQEITAITTDIETTNTDKARLLDMRNEDHAEFVTNLKYDADAIELLDMAIAALTKFYTRNRIPLSLLSNATMNYTIDIDKAPETIWSGPNYGGRKLESHGIIEILKMIKEDLEKEMIVAREDEAAAEAAYEKALAALNALLAAQIAKKMALEAEQADLSQRILDLEEHKKQKQDDLGEENDLQTALYSDCSWVGTHFDSRRTKRKTEIDGLVEAKGYLAGAADGSLLTR